jgi:curli biogenesis system outer membrane secretion channel CsgG
MRASSAGILALLVAILSACTTEPSESALRKKANAVRLLLPDTQGTEISNNYEFVATVKSSSCARQQGSDPSLEAAQKMLKMEAAKVGADAVINIACQETDLHFSYNCSHAIKCRGDAVKWEKTKSDKTP